MNSNDKFVKGTFNNNLSNTAFVDTCIQVSSDPIILNQLLSIIFRISKPVTVPSTDDSYPCTNRICFLAHYLVFIFLYFYLLISFLFFLQQVLPFLPETLLF